MKVLKAPIAKESRFLVYALVFTILCHGAAMLSMIALLLPGMPGGPSALPERVAYIADHALLWKLGWLPWQLTALSDLILTIALVRTAWIPRSPALISLAFTILALVAEQPAEYQWTTKGIELAQQAEQTGKYMPYDYFERLMFSLTSHWAAFFYTLAAIAWSVCLAKGGAWNLAMNRLSFTLWGLLLAVSAGPLLAPVIMPDMVATGNAIGFVLMMIWFAGALYLVKKKA